MKIAVSANGEDLASEVSEVFARCPYFIIAEIENKKIQGSRAIKNEMQTQRGGAGISAGQLMAEEKVQAVITKNLGPRAFDVLTQFGISAYRGSGPIKEVIEKFFQGELEKIE